MSRARRLTIVAVGDGGIGLQIGAALAERLRKLLGIPVALDKASFVRAGEIVEPPKRRDPNDPYSGESEPRSGGPGIEESFRASSNDLVDMLIGAYPEERGDWILALTALDLAAPGRSHVFGEATLGGQWAVVSTARLGAPGQPSPRLLERLCKEALHEVGHLAGLEHCASGDACVMNTAATVADVDARPPGFCDACAAAFTRNRVSGKDG